MRIGYLAAGHRGTMLKLTEAEKHPRKQLLDKLGCLHAEKMFVDTPRGTKHIGYIVGTEWFSIFEIHPWTGGKA